MVGGGIVGDGIDRSGGRIVGAVGGHIGIVERILHHLVEMPGLGVVDIPSDEIQIVAFVIFVVAAVIFAVDIDGAAVERRRFGEPVELRVGLRAERVDPVARALQDAVGDEFRAPGGRDAHRHSRRLQGGGDGEEPCFHGAVGGEAKRPFGTHRLRIDLRPGRESRCRCSGGEQYRQKSSGYGLSHKL